MNKARRDGGRSPYTIFKFLIIKSSKPRTRFNAKCVCIQNERLITIELGAGIQAHVACPSSATRVRIFGSSLFWEICCENLATR